MGRTRELDALRSAFDKSVDGSPQTVLISGEAGIGKSCLVQAAASEAARGAVTVLWGCCVELSGGSLPYAPLVGALRELRQRPDWPRTRTHLEPWLAPLGRLVPALAADLPPSPAADLPSPEVDQARLFEFVLAALGSLGKPAPVMLVLEDLHWADRASLDLLAFLVRNLRTERLLIIGTYRSDDLPVTHDLRTVLAELARNRSVTSIPLAPFDRAEIALLAADVLGSEVSPTFAERLLRRCDGNPFFAEELLAAGTAGLDEPPDALRDVILSRVSRLGADTRMVLGAAAVAGLRVDEHVLAGTCGLGEQRLRSALRAAVAHQVLVGDRVGDGYWFRHSLTQDAIYHGLLPGERVDMHAALAAALEEQGADADDPALTAKIAHHWRQAGRRQEEFRASVRAGQAAVRVLAYVEALAHLDRAYQLARRLPDAEAAAGLRPGELLELLAEAARWTGDIPRAVTLAERALRQLDQDADRLRAGLLYDFLGRCRWEVADDEGSLAAYRRVSELLPADAPGQARARAAAGEAGVLMLASRYQESLDRAREAVTLARAAGAVREESHALCTIGVDLSMLGDLPGALQSLRRALELAEQIENLEEICRAYTNLSSVLEADGQLEESAKIAREGLDRARRLGLEATGGGVLAGNAAVALFKLGRWIEAEEIVDDLLPSLTGVMRAYLALVRVELLGVRGQLAEAAQQLAAVRELAAQVTEVQLLGPLHAQEAQLALLRRDPLAALATVQDGLNQIVESDDRQFVIRLCALGVRALADHAELARHDRLGGHDAGAGGQPPADRHPGADPHDAARRLAEIAQAGVDDLAARGVAIPEAHGDLAECAAELGRLVGPNQPDTWDAALAVWDRLAQPYRMAYVRFRKAQALAQHPARAARAAAAAHLRDARDQAASLGALALVQDCTRLARDQFLGLTDPDAPSALAGLRLTEREKQVLPLLAAGAGNRQIASPLGITENTAGVHVKNIAGKLGVHTRGEAIAKLHELGLVPDPPEPDPPEPDPPEPDPPEPG